MTNVITLTVREIRKKSAFIDLFFVGRLPDGTEKEFSFFSVELREGWTVNVIDEDIEDQKNKKSGIELFADYHSGQLGQFDDYLSAQLGQGEDRDD